MDDVIIIGGSFAGLSAALQLGRARRRVTVFDTGQPRNRFSDHAHGMLGHDGKSPEQILQEGRDQLATYPSIELRTARVTGLGGKIDGFSVTTEDGEQFSARRLILSYGITDIMPDLPGFAQCWGKTVLHCPYCHGFEVADRRIGLLYSTPLSLHAMGLLHDWSERLTLFADGNDVPDMERQKLERRGVAIVDGKVESFAHEQGRLGAVHLANGDKVEIDALFAHPRQRLASDIHEGLSLEMEDSPIGQVIGVDDKSQTSTEGVYAAGDLAAPMQSAHLALSRGGLAGIHCHQSLAFADAN